MAEERGYKWKHNRRERYPGNKTNRNGGSNMYNEEKINRLQEDVAREQKKAEEKLDKLDSKIKVEELKAQKKLTKLESKRDVEMKLAQKDAVEMKNDARIEQKTRETEAARDVRQNVSGDTRM